MLGRAPARVAVRLLGPVDLLFDDQPLALQGVKSRAILAVLALEVGHVVSSSAIVDRVWGEGPPSSVRASMQVHISQLRRSLDTVGMAAAIVTRRPGYLLDVEPDAVDVVRFERATVAAETAAKRGDLSAAASLARSALEVWTGEPLGGLTTSPFVSAASARFQDMRLALIELAVEGELAVGNVHAAICELEDLVAAHPYRESLSERLATALYRAGRQADALACLTKLRMVLRDELGLNLGPSAAQLELAILTQDDALQPFPTEHQTGPQRPAADLAARDAMVVVAVTHTDNGPALLMRLGAAGYARLVEEYHILVCEVAARLGGAVSPGAAATDTVIVLPLLADSVRVPLEILSRVAQRWSGSERVSVGMGIHVGATAGPTHSVPITQSSEMASRLASAANEGQVLMSDAVAALLERGDPAYAWRTIWDVLQQSIGDPLVPLRALPLLAEVAVRTDDAGLAARLMGAAEHFTQQRGQHVPLSVVQSNLVSQLKRDEPGEFERGRSLNLDVLATVPSLYPSNSSAARSTHPGADVPPPRAGARRGSARGGDPPPSQTPELR